MAHNLAQTLVYFVVEEKKQNGRIVARICAALLTCPSREAFHKGFIISITHYYDCRDQLRIDHLKIWINFLNFIFDLYSSVGFTYKG